METVFPVLALAQSCVDRDRDGPDDGSALSILKVLPLQGLRV